MTGDFWQLTAVDLRNGLRRGTLTASEVVDAYLERIEERDEMVNAYVTVMEEEARENARSADEELAAGSVRGPLHGVPVAIKDVTAVAGARLTYGAKPFADHMAERDAAVVKRLKDAGAIVIGKTNTPEFGHKGTTDSRLTGPTNNPFNPELNAGGSSGGAAAAVADGMAPLAQGTDGGGSIRIPASFCGVVGIKPTFGLVPRVSRPNGFFGHTPYLHNGLIARTVEDAALLLDAMAGLHTEDPFSLPDSSEGSTSYLAATSLPVDSLSVAYDPTFDGFPIAETVREVVDNAITVLEQSVDTVTERNIGIDIPLGERRESWLTGRRVQHAMTAQLLERTHDIDLVGEHRDDLPAKLLDLVEAGRGLSALEYRAADVGRTEVFDALQAVFDDHDLLVTPTVGVPPFENGLIGPHAIDGQPIDEYLDWKPTYLLNLTGHPAASVPAGFTADGLPVGIQLIGPRGRDARVVAAGAALERMNPWYDRLPLHG